MVTSTGRSRKLEYRVIVGLIEPQWTGPREVNFGSSVPLDPKLFRGSIIGGLPAVDSAGSVIQSYGNPPFEWVQTRRLWFPRSITKPFAVEVDVEFPIADPVYSMALTFGGFDNYFGIEGEPLQIIQQGSAYGTPGGHTWERGVQTGSGGSGTYRYEYNGSLTANGEGPVRYVSWGYIHPVRKQTNGSRYAALGTAGFPAHGTVAAIPANPAVLMRVTRILVESNGAGYETEVWPDWTYANAGGNVDTAGPGERYVDDNITWAILPQRYLRNVNFDGPSSDTVPTAKISLSSLRGLFRDEPWEGRCIIIDTRMTWMGYTSEWRRQGVYTVKNVSRSRQSVDLSLRDRVLNRCDTPVSQGFMGLDPDNNQLGEIDAVNKKFYLYNALNTTVNVVDVVAGGPFPPTDRTFNVPSILPLALDSGGNSLLQFIYSIGDRLAQQTYTRFRRTGVGKYGELVMHLHKFGDAAPHWTFYGVGGAEPSTIIRGSARIDSNDNGPGQVFYRQNNPLVDGQQSSITGLPAIGTFPTAMYPGNAAEQNDSMAIAANVSMSVLEPYPNYAGVGQFGGVAKFRYFQENMFRRTITFDVRNIDFLEVGNIIAVDDPDGVGVTTDERWIITSLKHKVEKNRLITTIEAHTATIINALEKTFSA